MSSPAYNVANLLNTAAIGTLGTNLWINTDPGGTSLSIALYDTPGAAPNPVFARDFPNIQIIVNGPANDTATAYSKANEIKNYLLGITSQTIGTDIYFGFNMRSDIGYIGVTPENRPIFTMNWRFYIDHANVGNRISI